MKILVSLYIVLFLSALGLAQSVDTEQYSEKLIDDAKTTIEVVRKDRQELSENYREIAYDKENDEWYQEVEKIISEDSEIE